MAADLIIEAFGETARLDSHELVRQLNSHLGATLVATLAGVRDRKLPHKWAKAGGPEPRSETYARLQAAHRIWKMVSTTENDHVARAWFIGANPRLNEQAPVMVLRDGDISAVLGAAKAFIEGTDD